LVKKVLSLGAAAALSASTLVAAEAGSFAVKFGAHVVDPKSDNGSLAGGALDVTIDDDIQPTVMIEYYVTQHLGIELIAAAPFQHDVQLNGTQAATFKHLPPTVSVQYHFGDGRVSPYLGAGLNYTLVFDEETTGPLAGTNLSLSNSMGLAAHVGVDVRLSEKWDIGLDARWLDIDSDASVNGAEVGTVNVDPIAYGLYFQRRF
jgi:outer membrane protein